MEPQIMAKELLGRKPPSLLLSMEKNACHQEEKRKGM